VIRDRNIICFASGWDYHPTSKHHIMRRLAEHNHVIWVNWHASRQPGVGWSDLCSVFSKLRQIRRGPQPAAERITVLTPPQVPLPGSPLADRINRRIVSRAVGKVLDSLPPRPVQFWSFAPDVDMLVGCFDEELVLYYCVDAFGEFPGYDRELIERKERALIAKSDLVLTTSEPLHAAKRHLHSNVHLIRHGVDHAHLARAVHEPPAMPVDLQALPKPVIGFVGVVGEWVDLDLVAGLARSRPEASVVIIGPIATSADVLDSVPNVYRLGPKAHDSLPAYLSCFDVGLIPFRRTALTLNANPIKLYEYLAAGVPVVSTSLPAVEPWAGSVWLADTVEETVRACEAACRHNSSAERRRRSDAMKAHAWSARLADISRLIDATLGHGGAVPDEKASRQPVEVSRTPIGSGA